MNLKNIFIFILYFAITNIVLGQENELKNKALEEFKNEHYSQAVDYLEKAVKINPDDAEIYYYLGWFNHYRAYDSRPLQGYDFSYSEQIFKYLDKALELNPNYGNAKYFYGVECSANAISAMQNYNAEKLSYFYKLADQKGAYPKWLKEFGRNMLTTCDDNAILFLAGNADFDVCTYLQLHENFRKDITLIPIGNINRPWYVKFLKQGLKNSVKKINLKLTDEQIMDLHPFKWKTTKVSVLFSETYKEQFNLSDDYEFQWQVEPDLTSNRILSKINDEKSQKRTYLSPQRAILLQIIEDNFVERPIYFSNFCSSDFYGGLDKYFQNCGLISLLTPILTEGTNYQYNYDKIEFLLQGENLKFFKNIIKNDIPRISYIVAYGYYYSFFYLLDKDKKDRNDLKILFEEFLQIGYDKEYEKEIIERMNKQ